MATFTQSNGVNTVGNLQLGVNAGDSGTYNLTGGTLCLGGLVQGSGSGTLFLNGVSSGG